MTHRREHESQRYSMQSIWSIAEPSASNPSEWEYNKFGKVILSKELKDFVKWANGLERQEAREKRAKRRCKIERKQKRAAFRRKKRGLA